MNRKEYADRLMDAVGKIDDVYIYEAQTYRAKRKTPGYVKAAIGLSATLLIIISFAFPVLLSRLRKGGMMNDDTRPVSVRNQMYATLLNSGVSSYKELPEIDGAALVWQNESDMEYRVIPLNDDETDVIMSGKGEPAGDATDNGVKIWVVTSDGLYMTPELKKSDGNTDIKAFDYDPELIIPDAAAKAILKIVKEER